MNFRVMLVLENYSEMQYAAAEHKTLRDLAHSQGLGLTAAGVSDVSGNA